MPKKTVLEDSNYWKGYLDGMMNMKKIIQAEMAVPTSVFTFAKSILDEDEKAAEDVLRNLEEVRKNG